ncbi:MAG: Do family serine endopeptidase [Methylobacteriaceae bacterium]|nr:Do family serine endopeptidase [Methylobacteriaceae bacterium]
MSQSLLQGPARKPRLAATAAVAALIAAGAVGFLPPSIPAQAAQVDTSGLSANAMPSFAKVVERVKPAVVSVKVEIAEAMASDAQMSPDDMPPQLREFFKRFGAPGFGPQTPGRQTPRRAQGQGSGFFISGDGYVVTNNHVVKNAKSVRITTDSGHELTARVVGADAKTDLALLKVNEAGDYPFVVLSKDSPPIGDWVVAIGNPFGLGGTVTAGIVSAKGRDIGSGPYDDYLQIDAPINRGNSGGPTFNLKGEVVGVNTAIFSPSGGSIGVAFAIPASTVEGVVGQLKDGGKVSRAYLGVRIQSVTQDLADGLGLKSAAGALVDQAEPGTPAAKAGLKSGDVIVALNGVEVKDARDLTRRVGALKPGESAEIGYLRGGEKMTARVSLAGQDQMKTAEAKPAAGDAKAALGVRLAPAREVQGAGEEGVAVVGVDPDGQGAARGLKEGDVILEVGGRSVSRPDEVRAGVDSARKDGKKAILLKVKSAEGSRFVAVPFAG